MSNIIFINCHECDQSIDISEMFIYKKINVCKTCKELYEENDIAQPVRMIYKRAENVSYSCCSQKMCIHIKCVGNVQGHVHLYSCDPELVNYPGLTRGKNWSKHDDVYISQPFEETNLLRRLRLKKTERLKK